MGSETSEALLGDGAGTAKHRRGRWRESRPSDRGLSAEDGRRSRMEGSNPFVRRGSAETGEVALRRTTRPFQGGKLGGKTEVLEDLPNDPGRSDGGNDVHATAASRRGTGERIDVVHSAQKRSPPSGRRPRRTLGTRSSLGD